MNRITGAEVPNPLLDGTKKVDLRYAAALVECVADVRARLLAPNSPEWTNGFAELPPWMHIIGTRVPTGATPFTGTLYAHGTTTRDVPAQNSFRCVITGRHITARFSENDSLVFRSRNPDLENLMWLMSAVLVGDTLSLDNTSVIYGVSDAGKLASLLGDITRLGGAALRYPKLVGAAFTESVAAHDIEVVLARLSDGVSGGA